MVTRKALNIVAQELKNNKPRVMETGQEIPNTDMTEQWKLDVEALVRAFTQLNPRFDAELFRRECGFEWQCCRTSHG